MALESIHYCERCGAERRPHHWRFCSRLCADAARRKPRRPCEYCGGPTRYWKLRFCSLPCAYAAKTIPAADRFWAHVDRDGPMHPLLGTRCWLWTGFIGPSGYGQFNIGGRAVVTNRAVYELSTGHPPPTGMDVCHHCDVRHCVRWPEHLFLGTPTENVHDMIAKGRDRKARGEHAANVKLTENAVRDIRAAYSSGTMPTELGRRYGVSDRQIHDIVKRRSWRHVE